MFITSFSISNDSSGFFNLFVMSFISVRPSETWRLFLLFGFKFSLLTASLF